MTAPTRAPIRSCPAGVAAALLISTLAITPAARPAGSEDAGWVPFAPKPDPFQPAALDLRSLNERTAGDGGFIAVKGPQFVHSKTGEPVRFWAVNGPSGRDLATLRREARTLAKHGVNLARVHGGYYDRNGRLNPARVRHAHDVVAALKAEGIYTHFSVYFPLWLTPEPGTPWLQGYDGKTHPFAALFFNKDFQAQYREWWKALLLTPGPDGTRLIDDPSVAGVEILNEDSYFFWTFSPDRIPDAQLKILEQQFGDWLAKQYGSIDKALEHWGGLRVQRDDPAAGRVGFRPLWNMAHDKTARDQDTARFLTESQRGFYEETYRFLRGLGFRGVITTSNWMTASPEVLGPLEKYTYTAGDFIDRHGYFAGRHKGEAAEWSIRPGHTYSDRSALRFDPEAPGKPKVFEHPVMDPRYDGKPSMISETTFNRPNRYRSEAPLYYATYGALQGTNGVVHFAWDGPDWSVKPNYWMQPWTLLSPAMLGQFPATALLYRRGLVSAGDVLAEVDLNLDDLLALKGTPLPQGASLDELRLKDVPQGTAAGSQGVIDPLIHYAGRVDVRFTKQPGRTRVQDLSRLIDRKGQTVTSSTGELKLDYGRGVLTVNAPAAQGVSGALKEAGTTELKDLSVASGLDLGHIIAVSLDGQPLARSQKILLQVMSEEQTSGFRAEPVSGGLKRITAIGQDPWMIKAIEGVVRFKRPDAAKLRVTALDANGYPLQPAGTADNIRLAADTLYYLIAP